MTSWTPGAGRRCFVCGGGGHRDFDCTLETRTAAGVEAEAAFHAGIAAHRTTKGPRDARRAVRAALVAYETGDRLTYLAEHASKRALRALRVLSSQTFEHMADGVTDHVSHVFDVTQSQAKTKTPLDADLGTAVKEGSPATFEDPVQLASYTVGRLRCRARYLFKLLTSGVPEAAAARALLSAPAVRVVSMGGGPAFDHVALEAAAALVAALGGVDPARVHTAIFDLYAPAWAPFVDAVFDGCELNTTRHPGNSVTLHACDLRENAASPANAAVRGHVATSDLFLFSFVLHENAASVARGGTIYGLVRDILDGAKVGACVLCMDAGRALWPALAATAVDAGWTATARDATGAVPDGPRSYCCLRRHQRPL
jgi:hypothetical protein